MQQLFKKIILVAFYALAVTQASEAQTLHAVFVADTWVEDIGEGALNDQRKMQLAFNTIAEGAGYHYQPYVLKGGDFNKAQLETALAALNPASEDVVLFYYTGHGEDTDGSKWPTLLLGKGEKTRNERVPLTKIRQWLSRKNCRLRITIADCCNTSLQESDLDASQFPLASKGRGTTINADKRRFYRSLLQETKGDIIVATSSPGEKAYTSDMGSVYTTCFNTQVKLLAKLGATAGWKQLLTYSEQMTKKVVKGREVQNPMHEIALEEASNPSKPTPKPKPTPKVPGAVDNSHLVNLQELLNRQYSPGQRVSRIPKAMSAFNSYAKVEVYGDDGKTLLEVEPVRDFLERLAISSTVVSVTSIEAIKDNQGKITKLKIHEYYEE